jgi:hypothetical protein
MLLCAAGLLYPGEELSRADHELLSITLKHDGSFAGSESRPTLNCIGFASKHDLLPRAVLLKPLMIELRIDLFHIRPK